MTFTSFSLSPSILKALSDKSITTPTPIQLKAIPEILAGHDLIACAQTGTGKTAAFALPIIQRYSELKTDLQRPKALILTPTRELALQVSESFTQFAKYLPLQTTVVCGGIKIVRQVRNLSRGVSFVVATPGRLLDLMSQKIIDLRELEVLVLDEADRMLDMGFINDIRKIIGQLPRKRQNLLFSATFSPEIRKLASSIMNAPKMVDVGRSNEAAPTIVQTVYEVRNEQKRALLTQLITKQNMQQVLVFTRTKRGANRLTNQLNSDGINSLAIHGNKSQNARIEALKQFKDKKIRILVATDIAARGLDINSLPQVVNFDLPQVPQDYVHRIGRTGRAGLTGAAISFVSPEEQPLLVAIEKLIKIRIQK